MRGVSRSFSTRNANVDSSRMRGAAGGAMTLDVGCEFRDREAMTYSSAKISVLRSSPHLTWPQIHTLALYCCSLVLVMPRSVSSRPTVVTAAVSSTVTGTGQMVAVGQLLSAVAVEVTSAAAAAAVAEA